MNSKPQLERLGAPRIVQASANAPVLPALTFILSADLADGPLPGHCWTIEAASGFLWDAGGASNSPDPAGSGLFIVPTGTNPLGPTDITAGFFNAIGITAGVGLPVDFFLDTQDETGTYYALSERGVLIPYGYTLRGTFVCDSNMNPTSQMIVNALIQDFLINDPCECEQ